MSTETLYYITGAMAMAAAVALGLGGWQRRRMSTPAARAMALSLALWFGRYGLRLFDTADGHLTRLGETAGDPRTLALSTALLTISALLYVSERVIG